MRELDPEKIQENRKIYNDIREDSLVKMRKRHAGFTELVKEYRSFDDFMRDWYEKMTLFGAEVCKCSDCISIYIQLDFTDYEQYYVIMGKDGHLAMSPVVGWEDKCANTLTNIFTGEDVEDEDIVKG